MPKRNDLKKIMVIGSGPIVIGQACEFDYSGTQACKVLKDLGYKVVLHNSNPATIMTDPEFADATYIEPLTVDFAREIIAKEKPCAILPTVGGQTGLNLAMELHKCGVLDDYNVELIGAKPKAIAIAEDRDLFKKKMIEKGIPVAPSGIAHSLEDAKNILEDIGLPLIIRPSYTLGGEGGGVANTIEEYNAIVSLGLHLSPISQVLIEKSALGWKEFEMELIRDKDDNAIVVCSIENFDPMGVHTGDSITVAPAQTLTDVEYQKMRTMSFDVIRAVGVETGGSNIQFAIDPDTGYMFVIEMNPRVSRSSALASKATGFPIAKIAAQLAVGLTLGEIKNDITKKTPACFEPALDYTVVKIPRWNTEKFKGATTALTTQMKAVGEVMAIGTSFSEAMRKALQSLELKIPSYNLISTDDLLEDIAVPQPDRIFKILELITARDITVNTIHRITKIDRWFLENMFEHHSCENKVFKMVDTCAAEFESSTPYLYSTTGYECELPKYPEGNGVVTILGNGPNRIGQGLEFDYCCVHASMALKEMGYLSAMVNCNPETVSTDYDTSDILFFEPITKSRVNDIVNGLGDNLLGSIVQFGGQTPLKLANDIGTILGSAPSSIDICEDRKLFNNMISRLGFKQPPGFIANTILEAQEAKDKLGYPVLVRPSYVLGGKCMHICYNDKEFNSAVFKAYDASNGKPLLIDKFLSNAIEYDVDVVCDIDGNYEIAAIMEHIEEAGIHSGDSSCIIPSLNLKATHKKEIEVICSVLCKELKVIGLMNIQLAIKNDVVYIIEVNPRASRTVPFASKATGVPWAKIATYLCMGELLDDVMEKHERNKAKMFYVKSPVFPWRKFSVEDTLLGPEMKSTGEVMGVGETWEEAYLKAMLASGINFRDNKPNILISIANKDKDQLKKFAYLLHSLTNQSNLYATKGTYDLLKDAGIKGVKLSEKFLTGHKNSISLISDKKIDLVLNTTSGEEHITEEAKLRLACLRNDVPCITSLFAIKTMVRALNIKPGFFNRSVNLKHVNVKSLQEIREEND